MNILFIGDVFGRTGRKAIKDLLPNVKKDYDIDFCIANGENLAGGIGTTAKCANEMFNAGVDMLSGGNHSLSKNSDMELFKNDTRVIRPANLGTTLPGRGMQMFKVENTDIAVLNLIGKVFIKNESDNPFKIADIFLKQIPNNCITIVDFHAEASAEKQAMAYHLDGRVSAVIGTHTHVQTNDECILPGGTAYITDAGMTGAKRSVIGNRVEDSLEGFVYGKKMKLKSAGGAYMLNGVLINLDRMSKYPATIKTIRIYGEDDERS